MKLNLTIEQMMYQLELLAAAEIVHPSCREAAHQAALLVRRVRMEYALQWADDADTMIIAVENGEHAE